MHVLIKKGIARGVAALVYASAINMSIGQAFGNEQSPSNPKSAPAVDTSTVVGEVVFTVGPAQALGASNRNDGTAPVQSVLSRGHKLKVGDQLLTGAGGHVHVRFVDGAFVAVRPESQLLIEQYSYKPAQPDRSTVKFQLMQGTARSITGRAGEAAKDRFRLNTPLAAIGVRGTDFVVLTQETESRAVVNSGAIVVAPIGQGCSAEGLGPCSGISARELTPAMGDLMARVERGKIELVTARGLAPERANPLGAEPRAQKEKESQAQPHAAAAFQATAQLPSTAGAGGISSANSSSSTSISPTGASTSAASSAPSQSASQVQVSSSSPVVVSSVVAVLGLDASLPGQDKSSDAFSVPKAEQAAIERVQGAGTGAKSSGATATGSGATGSGGSDKLTDTIKPGVDTKPTDSIKPGPDLKPLDTMGGSPAATQDLASADKAIPEPVKPSESASSAGLQQAVVASGTPNVAAYVNPLASKLLPATLQWGRWASQPMAGDNSDTAVALLLKGASPVMSASDWSLFAVGSTQSARPREGMVDFVLRDALAYYQPVLGSASQAEITGGSLGMDFARATFSSRLNAKHQDVGQVLVMIHGTITSDGQLQSASDSPAAANGVLANDAREAAYRFSQRVTDTKGRVGNLFGLTRWVR